MITLSPSSPANKPERKHVKIYPQDRNGKVSFILSWSVGKKRERKRLSDETAAEIEADRLEGLLVTGHAMISTTSTSDLSALAMFRQGEPDVPLGEVFAVYHANKDPRGLTRQILTSTICAEFQVERLREKSTRHVQTVRNHISKFEGYFGPKNFPGITTQELTDYIRVEVGGALKTRKNHLITLCSLFRWAKAVKKCLPFNEPTAAESVEKPVPEAKEHEVYTPEEAIRHLAATPTCNLSWMVLGNLAGVRAAERGRLSWNHWKEDREAIVLTPDITKTNRRRSVDVSPSLKAWLTPLRGKAESKMVPYHNPHKKLAEVVSSSGVVWKDNAQRAGFVSYHLELHGDMPLTAKNSGHSVRELEESYLNLVSKTHAAQWFAITPKVVLDFCKAKGLPVPEWASLYEEE